MHQFQFLELIGIDWNWNWCIPNDLNGIQFFKEHTVVERGIMMSYATKNRFDVVMKEMH
jgi:hypothetical protein